MKVLWLSHFAPYPPKGGSLQRSFNLFKQLSKHADVTLLALATYSKITAFYDTYDVGITEIDKELSAICSKVVLVPHGRYSRKTTKILNGANSVFRANPYDVLWLQSSQFKDAIASLLELESYDLIHVDTIGLWPYVAELSVPKMLNHHNIESIMLERRAENEKSPLKQYLKSQAKKLAALEKVACHRAALNITCSELDSERLEQRYGVSNLQSIPNGVDLEYFFRKSVYKAKRPIKLVFAGGLDHYPNRDAVILFASEIWPLLKAKGVQVEMTVVGRGSIKQIDDLANKDKAFRTTGFVPDVRPYLEDAMIYVCPIRDGGGTKLKVLDALAMGVPLVVHPIACEGIAVTDRKEVILAESAVEFVDAILALSEDGGLRENMSHAGRELIQAQYSYESIGQQMARAYSAAIA